MNKRFQAKVPDSIDGEPAEKLGLSSLQARPPSLKKDGA